MPDQHDAAPQDQRDALDGPLPETTPSAAPDTADAPVQAAGRRPTGTSLLTWGTVALVLLIVVVLVVAKLTGSTPSTTSNTAAPPQPAPAAVVAAVTKIPATVYDTVGVTSSVAMVTPPTVVHGQAPLDYGGKPGVLFVGSEFCPFCAAERWAVAAALSRFGRFTVLPQSESGSQEVFASTPTFTFDGARYESRYIGTDFVETYSDARDSTGTGYGPLEQLTRGQRALLRRYRRSSSPTAVAPFLDVDNQAVQVGGLFSPAVLQQLSMSQIATGLADPKDPATQAIVAAANYLSAAICDADGGRPASVCTSKGVQAAQAAMHPAS